MTHKGKSKKALALLLSLLLALSFAPLFSVVLLPQANAAVSTNRNNSSYVYGHYYYYPAGTTFIKSIHVGYDKDKDTAQSNAINGENPILLGQDWLDGMGSNIFKRYHYIYIAYGTTTDITQAWGTYIRMKHSSGTPSPYAFTVNGQSVNFDLGSDVDFNKDRGSGSDYIYLYKTADPRFGLPITEFRSGDGNTDAAKWESYFLTAERDNTGEVSDFNRNAGGHYLWLHYGNYSVYTDVTTYVNALQSEYNEAVNTDTTSATAESRAALQSAIADAAPILQAYNSNIYKCASITANEIQLRTAALRNAINGIATAYYTVTFAGDGNTGGSMTEQRIPVAVNRNLSANGFTREFTVNYEYNGATGGNAAAHDVATSQFSGWARSQYGQTVYDDRESVKDLAAENGTIGLHANWTDSAITLPTPTKEGYDFKGWYTDSGFYSPVNTNNGSYIPNADITLYAKWDEHTYNLVSFSATKDHYSVTQQPPATAKTSTSFNIKLNLAEGYRSCEPVVTCNTGTVTMQPHGTNAQTRTYTITGVTDDYIITVGNAVQDSYAVTFVDGLSGDQLGETQNVAWDEAAIAPEMTDYEYYSADQHVKFTGWDKDFEHVKTDMTVTAQYALEDHTWDEDANASTPATCQNAGETKYQCRWCPAQKTEEVPVGDHSYTRQIVSADTLKEAATCLSAAKYYYTCATCDAVEHNDSHTFTSGSVAAHSYTADTVKEDALKSAANCTDPAVYYYSCATCGAVENNDEHTFTSGSANGHSYEWIVDKNANCGETGLKHEECSVCHNKRNEGTVIPTEGEHQFGWIIDTPATCVAAGEKHQECSVCHATQSEGTVIDATGIHTLSKTAAKPATCTADGNSEYYTCSVCRQRFASQSGGDALTDEDIVIQSPGHIFTAEKAEARYLLSAATCTEAAVYYKSCVNCGEKGSETFIYGEPNGHSFEWVIDLPETCAEPGLKHEKCKKCPAVRNENTVINANGQHNYTKQTVKDEALKSAATCTAPAVYYYSCSVCGGVEGNVNHTFKNGTSLGHRYGDWIIDKEPSCTEEGTRHRVCSVCNNSQPDTIAKTDHVDADGDYRCDNCNADITPAGLCPYCHQSHSGFPGVLIGFFHRILYFFQNLFG